MKTKTSLACSSLTIIFALLGGCASVPNIVPQLPTIGSANSPVISGQDIAIANNLLKSGQQRQAADAYFRAAQNYASPERERLILQAAELAAVFKDPALTQQYLAPISFNNLSTENQARFRFTQAQLALNDRNYRETLRILPQRVNDIPTELGQKILAARMSAAQSSGDKLSLVQELVLQESTLTQPHLVSLNHDRIWNHVQQIPSFQLDEAKNSINHPIVKNWLSLAQLSRVAKNGPASKRQSLRGDLGAWIQNNPNHPGMTKAVGILNAAPITTVTPYSTATKPVVQPKPVVVNRAPAVAKRAPVVVKNKPIVLPPTRVTAPAPVAKPAPIQKPVEATPQKTNTAYDLIKKELNLP